MGALQWDRMLETCHKRNGSELLLFPGSPPMIRMRRNWRAMDVPPIDAPTLQALAQELIGKKPDGQADGYTYSEFGYGDMRRLRAMAFGYPDTRLLIVARFPRDEGGEQVE
jgi:Tfp pilus assembly pilus retraction ATPase PilT